VIDIPRAPQSVVAVVVRDHHQLGRDRHTDLTLEPAQVGGAALQIVQQTQYIDMRAQVIPQRHKGLLECE